MAPDKAKKRKKKADGAEEQDPDAKKGAKKRKKSLVERIDGPSAQDKLLPRTLEERMAAQRVVVVLEKSALELVQPRKGAYELLNSDDHKNILAKSNREFVDARPDILHQCLMTLLDSPLNKAGKLLIYIHSSQNTLVEVNPSLRVPRTFKRFSGLCVELLQRSKIRAAQANETLMKVVSNPVTKYLPPGARLFGMSVAGKPVKFRDFASSLSAEMAQSGEQLPIVFAVGAVAKDDPVSEADFGANYVEQSISICPWGLSASCVCSKICNEFESLWGIC
eukprot:gnl/TRDRNA2_/TRDRNA2_56398_c0_seq1.p1 gnl/TRDRNA2_/TRDRNA2_56398_c0~~gnl/TRDRNA2_/TRDRNA2_56398_c0_seq1.p1  ORF type:complete len:295 (+),score=71.48 gnl/TRDRNA2_/TRDRNA2_56398_c0_seq1:50-886(+)